MSSDESDPVFDSDEEKDIGVASDQTYVKQSDDHIDGEDGAGVEFENEDDAKKYFTSKKSTHPSYLIMIQQSITDITSGKTGKQAAVSKIKVCEYIRSKYGIEELNNTQVKRALNIAVEKGIIEHTTGIGASGSFKLTKSFKEKSKKKEEPKKDTKKGSATTKDSESSTTSTIKQKKAEPNAGKSAKSATKDHKTGSKPTGSKKTKKSGDDDSNFVKVQPKRKVLKTTENDRTTETKKVTKKAPAPKSKDAQKKVVGKENTERKAPKETTTGLKKSASTGTIIKKRTAMEVDENTKSAEAEMPRRRGRKAAK